MRNVLIKSDFDRNLLPMFEKYLGMSIEDITNRNWNQTDFVNLQNCLKILFKREQTHKEYRYQLMRETLDIQNVPLNKALSDYSSLQSEKINRYLFDEKTKTNHNCIDAIKNIDSIFSSVAYTTGRLPLYRGMSLPDYIVVEAMRDCKFVNRGYSSFSISRQIANVFSVSKYCPLISNRCGYIDEFTNMADKISIFVIANNNQCLTLPMFDNTNIPQECEFLVDRDAIYDIVSFTNQFVDNKLVAQTWHVNLR